MNPTYLDGSNPRTEEQKRGYRRAFSTLGCPEASLDEVLSLAGQHQIDALELRLLGGSRDLPQYMAEHDSDPVWCEIRGKGRIAALDTMWRVVGGTDTDRAKFLEFVPWAERLGVRWLRVFDGGKTGDDRELAEAAAGVRWWQDVRAKNGWLVDIMVETHDSLISAAIISRYAEAVPRVALLWDAFNTWIKSGENPVDTWRGISKCGIAIPHIHVKDGIREPWNEYRWTMTLPGSGALPMAQLLPILRAEFSGVLSLEWEKIWHPYLPALGEALRAANQGSWW